MSDWYANHASHVIDGAVRKRNITAQQEALDRKDKEVNRWMQEVAMVSRENKRIEALEQKWKKLTARERKAVIEFRNAHLTPEQREREAKKAKVDSAFIDPKQYKYTAFHRKHGIHPMATLHGPLPNGWHRSKKNGITVYWNDFGAKQLHLPRPPLIATMSQMSEAEVKSHGLKSRVESEDESEAYLSKTEIEWI